MKKNKGITLIALVITIIVLIILAGIALAALKGDNSIIAKANDATRKHKKATEEEENILNKYIDIIDDKKDEADALTRYFLGEDLNGRKITEIAGENGFDVDYNETEYSDDIKITIKVKK